MKIKINKSKSFSKVQNIVFVCSKESSLSSLEFSKDEITYIKKQKKDKKDSILINRYTHFLIVHFLKKEGSTSNQMEECRKAGHSVCVQLKKLSQEKIQIVDVGNNANCILAFTEGLLLSNYSFDKYKSKKEDNPKQIKEIRIISEKITVKDINELSIITESVCMCRDLVNEPVGELNAPAFAKIIRQRSEEVGLKVEIFNKSKIESLKMGGLLAVNKGSVDPPFFAILEWKPNNAKNKKPYILVGKGIVYDTGGMNIKTGSFMENMKSDMGGAASVFASIYAMAKLKLNVHIIALIPSTDNRLNGNAYVSGDIIKMYDGTTVEVVNTDAEGRLILADALSYAKNYKPSLVIDVATLTGAAHHAIGHHGVVAMNKDASETMKKLKNAGDRVYERIAEFPFWDEYDELIKSQIADIKNIGGGYAGMITAGKFLAHFTDYPFIHLDIAGPAFIDKKDNYRGQGGTGIPTRLLIDFIKNEVK